MPRPGPGTVDECSLATHKKSGLYSVFFREPIDHLAQDGCLILPSAQHVGEVFAPRVAPGGASMYDGCHKGEEVGVHV